jgi:integrase
LEGTFEDLLDRAEFNDFRFHDRGHTFASWYVMNGDDLYELAKTLGHSNIKMTERYSKLAKQHIARTSGGNFGRSLNHSARTPRTLVMNVRVLFAR